MTSERFRFLLERLSDEESVEHWWLELEASRINYIHMKPVLVPPMHPEDSSQFTGPFFQVFLWKLGGPVSLLVHVTCVFLQLVLTSVAICCKVQKPMIYKSLRTLVGFAANRFPETCRSTATPAFNLWGSAFVHMPNLTHQLRRMTYVCCSPNRTCSCLVRNPPVQRCQAQIGKLT